MLAAPIAILVGTGVVGEISADTADPRARLVREAIVDAVRDRMAPARVMVTVDSITDIRLEGDVRSVTARVSPYARAGTPARFVLTAPGGGRGETTAQVHVLVEGVRTRVPIRRGAYIADGDVEILQIDLARRPIRRVPILAEVVGAKAQRDLEAGATVMKGDVAPQPAVRAGREVVAHAAAGAAHVTGRLVAAQNGARHQIIRVVNPETHAVRRARVVDVDEVEVLHGQ
jgi:flagella basal body P-ring formation protein FlgA